MPVSGVLPAREIYCHRSVGGLAMVPFGFTPDDGDDADRNNKENLEAMMRQMQ